MNIKDHLPEILTGVAVGGEIAADFLFVRAAKKEAKDGKKKHYVLPAIVSGASITSIIASNRISNEQKLSLLAASTLSSAQLVNYKKAVKETVDEKTYADISKKYSDDELEKLKAKAKEYNKGNDEDDDYQLFYFDQFDILVQSTPQTVSVALLNMNQEFCTEGWVSAYFFFNWIDKDLPKKDPYLKKHGKDVGWSIYEDDPYSGYNFVTVNEYAKKVPGLGRINYIHFMEEPLEMSEWDEYYEKQFDSWQDLMNIREERTEFNK